MRLPPGQGTQKRATRQANRADVGGEPSIYAPTVPCQAHVMVQLRFAIIAPAFITAACAGVLRITVQGRAPFRINSILGSCAVQWHALTSAIAFTPNHDE